MEATITNIEFEPIFKENDNDQFVYKNGEWVKSNELTINCLWRTWLVTEGALRKNIDGYIVYGIKKQ